MSNNEQLPAEVVNQIAYEAKIAAAIIEWGEYDSGSASSARMVQGSRIDPIQKEFYIKGATEWAERAKGLADALRELVDLKYMKDEGLKMKEYLDRKPAAWTQAIIALQQWKDGKGKEVERPCPHCGKELSRDRNLCCRECGKEVKDDS